MRKTWAAMTMAVMMAAAQSVTVLGASITTTGTVVVPVDQGSQTSDTDTTYRSNGAVPDEIMKQGPGAVLEYTKGTGGYIYTMDEKFHENNQYTDAEKKAIEEINAGRQAVSTLPSDTNTTGYEALIRIQEIHKKNAVTSAEIREKANEAETAKERISLYVPNLIEGLQDVKVMWYNSETKKWELLNPALIDYKQKIVTVDLTALGPVTVVYKK